MNTYIIPCSDAKLAHAAPARHLYTGTQFRHTLRAVEAMLEPGDRVLVLSALHGLVALDTVLHPYEQRMGAPGSVDPFVACFSNYDEAMRYVRGLSARNDFDHAWVFTRERQVESIPLV